MEFFDTHTHYNDEQFDNDRKQVILDTKKAEITRFTVPGYNLESSRKAIVIAEENENVYATCGISPNDVDGIDDIENEMQKIEEMIKNRSKVVAVGEIGLDYYWNKENMNIQKKLFVRQIEIANKYGLPIVIHTREAVMDTLEILKNEAMPEKRGIFHCCPFNRELVKEALRLGFYISFAGPTTFKSSKNAEEIIKLVPNDRILIETDSPYLAPEPVRGSRNNSINVKFIAEKIATVKEISLEEIATITMENAKRIFEIKE